MQKTPKKSTPERIPISSIDKTHMQQHAFMLRKLLTTYLAKEKKRILREITDQKQEIHDKTTAFFRACQSKDEALLSEYGFNFQDTWLLDIVALLLTNRVPIEIQALTVKVTGNPLDIVRDNEIGFELTRLLQKMIEVIGDSARLVVELDDYGDTNGRRLRPDESEQYYNALIVALQQKGLASPDEHGIEAGYHFDRLSLSAGRIPTLLANLRASKHGSIIIDHTGNTYFKPSEKLLPTLGIKSRARTLELGQQGILLVDAQGEPTQQALIAASFTDILNQHIVHVLILGEETHEVQDKVYALLRAIDFVRAERYHNIYLDYTKLTPSMAAYGMGTVILWQIEQLINDISTFDSWSEFDSQEYMTRNYGSDTIMPEDEQIIASVARALKRIGIKPESLERVADVGAGPNLYPSMLITPYITPKAKIDLLDFSPNRNYLAKVFKDSTHSEETEIWRKFERYMIKIGGDIYRGAEAKARKAINIQFGDIFTLPAARYELITSYFVAESVVNSLMPFREAIQSLARAVKPGGILIIAHMVGSEGYYAGEDTRFPAVNVSLEHIRQAYYDADLELVSLLPITTDGKRPREGYHGMALAVAVRQNG